MSADAESPHVNRGISNPFPAEAQPCRKLKAVKSRGFRCAIGVVVDEYARVVDKESRPIPGLYAAGNATASIFGRTYPGAGASIGAAFTFGFVAAHHSAGSNTLAEILS